MHHVGSYYANVSRRTVHIMSNWHREWLEERKLQEQFLNLYYSEVSDKDNKICKAYKHIGGGGGINRKFIFCCKTCREESIWGRYNQHGNNINPLNAELNPICHFLALAGAHHFVHVSRLRVNTYFSDTGYKYATLILQTQDRVQCQIILTLPTPSLLPSSQEFFSTHFTFWNTFVNALLVNLKIMIIKNKEKLKNKLHSK